MHKTSLAILLALTSLSFQGTPASAQGFINKDTHDLPDASKFYMARQQITITDDGPIINDQRTGAGAAAAGMGGMPRGPVPLPKAGWQPYSSTLPGVRSGLPQVNNGVPPRMPDPPRGPSGIRANAGNLRPRPKAAAPRTPTVQSYKAYKGYGPGSSGGTSGYGNSGSSSSTSVKGSVLHWARPKSSY